MATLNPALDKKDVLINGVMGLYGESGEAIDIVKKWLMQGHEPDKKHLVRELGDVGVFHSLGALWLRVLNELETKGAEGVYTDNTGESAEVKELLYLTAEVQDAALPDAIIEKHKVQAEYDWMVRNFTVQEEVPELHHENSSFKRKLRRRPAFPAES